MSNKEYYVWMVKCLGTGNVRSHKILEVYNGDIEEFYEDCKSKRIKRGLRLTETELGFLHKTNLEDIEFVFEKYSRFNSQTVTIEDELYPRQLKNIDNPPLVLFVAGDITHLNDELLLTVVGTRKESLYGRRAGQLICSELCVSGFSIVSGLAYGGDTTAHETALKCGARTYGLLACGFDVDYPSGKGPLKNAILRSGGAVITEFLPGTNAFPENFHIRNRIMSGLSVGTLVIEAPKRSGTIITANCAANQGRDVFAVPSGIFWKNGAGTLKLIQDGAKPVHDALDIIEDYIDRFPDKIKVPNHRLLYGKIEEENKRLGLSDENSEKAVSDQLKKAKKAVSDELKKAGKVAGKKAKDTSEEKKSALTPEERLRNYPHCDDNALKVLELIRDGSMSVEEIITKTNIGVSKVLISITKLELSETARKIPGNRIEIIP